MFLAGNSGSQSVLVSQEINSAADRSWPEIPHAVLGGKVLGKLGASVQNIPGGELLSASVVRARWTGLEVVAFADEARGFQEVARSITPLVFHEPGSGMKQQSSTLMCFKAT